MISNKSEVINMFFMKELGKLIDKYNNLDEGIISRIEMLMAKVKDSKFKENLMLDFNKAVSLIEELGDDYDEAILNLYMFLNKLDNEITIKKAKEIYESVEYNGYFASKDIIIYSQIRDLREYVKSEIYDILNNSYEIDRLFHKDVIIDYFIDGTSIEEVAKEMLNNCDEYEEILNISPEIMFEDGAGKKYYYASIDI